MGYVGRGLNQEGGQYRKLDDISSSFDGSETSFTLKVSGLDVTPTAQNLLISINGVIQEPGTAFSMNGATITFSEAPSRTAGFFGIVMGEASYIAYDTIGANEMGVSAGAVSASSGVVVDTNRNIQGFNKITSTSFSGIFEGALSSSAQIADSLPSNTISSSAQLSDDISGSLSSTAVAGLGASIISASVLSSPSQGTIRLATNGVNTDVDSGLQTGDSPTFTNGTYTNNLGVSGSMTVKGTLTAQEIHTEFTSASVIFTSGSTIFGDTSDDLHRMTGSLNVSGSLTLNDGTLTVTDNVDFNGDLDVDGTTNLDVVDIDGNVDVELTASIGKVLVDGDKSSIAAPGLAFDNDTDTGMYWGGTNAIGLVTGGSVALELQSTNLADFRGDLQIPHKIQHSGDTDNYLSFGTDSLSIYHGGAEKIQFNYGNIYIKTNNQSLAGYTTGGGAKELIKINASDNVQIGEAGGGDVKITERLTVGSWDNSNTHGHAYIDISSDANEGADSCLYFNAGTAIKGSIYYNHNATASSQQMYFVTGDNSTNSLILDNSGATFAGDVTLGTKMKLIIGGTSEIKHDDGAGSLTLMGDQVNIKNRAGDETGLSYNDGGGVIFYGNISLNGSSTRQIKFDDGATSEGAIVFDEITNGFIFKVGGTSGAGKKDAFRIDASGTAMVSPNGIGTSDNNARTLTLGGRPSDSNYVTLGFDSDKTYRGSWDFTANTGDMSYWVYDSSWKQILSMARDGQTQILNTATAQVRIKSTSSGDGILDLVAGGANDTQVRFYEDTTFKWRLRQNAGGSDRIEIINSSDTGVSLGWGGNTWGTQSDERIKENLIEITGATEKLNQLRCVNYNYTFDKEREHLGLIAQEVQKIYPEIVDGDPSKEIEETINEDGIVERKNIMSIEYTSLIPVLVKSIQELSIEVEKLKGKVNEST